MTATAAAAVAVPRSLPALFARGGTSTGLVIRAADLPPRARWGEVLPGAMGSPDPRHGRQLDGMGGGASSTSKVCVLGASARADADVDFTFVQVGIRDGLLDVAGNCGNMSSVVGPVAWDWGFVGGVEGEGGGGGEGGEYREAVVRIFNTNTSKVIHSRFRVSGDPPRYCPRGDYAMDGVPGTQSRITLSFLDPAGAKTGKALPTGNAVDVLELPDGTSVRASLVDVSNPGVFVCVEDLGISDARPGTLTPAVVEADAALKARLEEIRRAGASKMGLDQDTQTVPKIVLLFPRSDDAGDGVDIRCLAMSMQQAHKAVPLTLALCLGAAANMEGTLAWVVRSKVTTRTATGQASSSVVIGHPSGSVEIGTTVEDGRIVSADLHRTARVLMKGEVYY
ncbi:methylitaconate delta2-delta3-isomerase [Xylariaceae sp. FL0016]|nr:methylitaconate delta2-delta3-isomerase [Xylariaceae sp. FL0016]